MARRKSRSFRDREKHEAEDFLISIENAKRTRTYVDPDAGNIGFAAYAWLWLGDREIDASSRDAHSYRIRCHLVPLFADQAIGSLEKPEKINEWNWWKLRQGHSEGTRAVSFVILKAIFASAVENHRINVNPCLSKTVSLPRQRTRKITPWPRSNVLAIRAALAAGYREMVDVAAGCGLRQGEIFGLSPDNFEFGDRDLWVRRQVKRVRNVLVFGLPKNDQERKVPLPDSVAEVIERRMLIRKPVMVTLPWEEPTSDVLVTVPLIFVGRNSQAINKGTFAQKVWAPALRRAGIEAIRENGMHALRHHYASILIDAGESIKVVSENLGHSDPAFTWRTYVHLIKGSEDRTRQAIDRLAEAEQNGSRPRDGLEPQDPARRAG